MSVSPPDLSVNFCGLEFRNPFILPSAQPVRTRAMIRRAFQAGWAGAVTQSISADWQRIRNVQPRLHAFRVQGMLVGIVNIDLISDRPLEEWLDDIRALREEFPDQPLIASIMGEGDAPDEWQLLAERCQQAGASALELNLSCPHGMPERGTGAFIGQNPHLTQQVVRWVCAVASLPVIAKLTPNVTDIAAVAQAAVAGGASGITAINNLRSLAGIDVETFKPQPAVGGFSTFGGYAGAGIKPVGLRCVAEIAQALPGVPIAATGGIENWSDAVEYLLAGANITQIYTLVMEKGVGVITELTAGLSDYLARKHIARVRDLSGASLPYIISHASLPRRERVVAQVNYDLCIRCDVCYTACEDTGYQAIRRDSSGTPYVSAEACDGCGLCVQLRPLAGCIETVPRLP